MSFISFDFFCPCTTEYVAPKGTRIINIIVGVFFAPGFVLKNKTKKLLRKHIKLSTWDCETFFFISWYLGWWKSFLAPLTISLLEMKTFMLMK